MTFKLPMISMLLVSVASGMAIDPSSIQSSASIPPVARIWFEHLARNQIDQQGISKLSKVPGVVPALIELATKLVTEGRDSEHAYFVLDALRQCKNLQESQQEWLRGMLLPLIGQDRGSMGDVIKEIGLDILADYPTPRNEDLLIRYLADRKGNDNPFGYSFIAAKSLGKTGSAKAIQPLRDYAARIQPPVGQGLDHYDTAIESIKQIENRLSAGADVAHPMLPGDAAIRQGKSLDDPAIKAGEKQGWSAPALFWLMVPVAADPRGQNPFNIGAQPHHIASPQTPPAPLPPPRRRFGAFAFTDLRVQMRHCEWRIRRAL